MAGIYVHVPFCRKACYYCNFHFSTNLSLSGEMTDAICLELEMVKEQFSPTINTLYLGGGTPSVLPVAALKKILSSIKTNYPCKINEFTIEVNPDDIREDYLIALKGMGVTRLSIGAQTFDDQLLKFINRSHTAKTVREAYTQARELGFDNINLDLIYGLPKSTTRLLKKDLDIITAMRPEHISIYAFTLEKQTVFGNWAQKGRIHLPDEETEADEFELIMDYLNDKGYMQYEISNFCLPGYESGHNQAYWTGEPYIGIGPGAHSFDGQKRWYNLAHNKRYINAIQSGILPQTIEPRTTQNALNEYIFTSLRTSSGCDLGRIKREHNTDLSTHVRLHDFITNGLLLKKEGRLILTKKGKMLADYVASELMI
ncbi:MAG: radical SAM family heme chaperone HemW [Cyclobacteriaceae bacterium]|nr:radical SAM family heme chaperone HemW [Cyclobacteriaceae bacterium]